jgi:phosphoglycerate dehydrogenase-like enzyme
MTMRQGVLMGDLPCRYGPHIRSALTTDWQVRDAPDGIDRAQLATMLAEAEALIATRVTRDLPPMPQLRLLQVAAAGYDGIDVAAVPAQVAICNAYGHEDAIGEYAVAAMTAWRHGFIRVQDEFRAGSWAASSFTGGAPHRELAGSTVLIVGTGRIGRAIGGRAKAWGCRVIGCNRTVRPAGAELDALYGLDRLGELLPEADFVVLACGLDASTRGLIDAARLGRMRADAVLVNVARGPVVDEEALFEALAAARIGGAILDVWWRYPSDDDPSPRPSRLPFHELRNVLMTPHVSGWTDGLFRRRSGQMAENLDHLARGEPLINVVRPAG